MVYYLYHFQQCCCLSALHQQNAQKIVLLSLTAMLLFEEAMKQGHIEVSIIKCLLFGPAGVGKSCLLRLLLDMLPPPLRQSTACIEQAIRAVCVKCGIDSEGEWQKVDSDRLCDLLAGSVSKQATSIRDCKDSPPDNCMCFSFSRPGRSYTS